MRRSCEVAGIERRRKGNRAASEIYITWHGDLGANMEEHITRPERLFTLQPYAQQSHNKQSEVYVP